VSTAALAGAIGRLAPFLRREWPVVANVVTMGLFLAFGRQLLADLSHGLRFWLVLAWLLGSILLAVFAVVRHAERVAAKLGEPLGTLVLTLAITGIEVMIIVATMSAGHGSPTLARDTTFAVIMIVLNGMVGLTLLVGGLKYREQDYNLQGANAFLAVILPLAVMGLILPNHTLSSPDKTFSPAQAGFLTLVFLSLYGVFLTIQNFQHRAYFRKAPGATAAAPPPPAARSPNSAQYHALLLLAYLGPLVVLAEQLAVPIDYMVRGLGAPAALAGFLIAAIVLSPESMVSVRAALGNDLQRSVNILLGSALASIGLTIPAMLVYGLVTDYPVILGLDPANVTLLALTLVLCATTLSSSRTNVLLGAVHLVVFLAYVMLIFQR
jgi:Ca2+:H+ antiporter